MRLAFSWSCCSPRARGAASPNLPGTFGPGEPLPPPVAPEPVGRSRRPRRRRPGDGAGRSGRGGRLRDAKARFDSSARRRRRALDAFVAHHGAAPFVPRSI